MQKETRISIDEVPKEQQQQQKEDSSTKEQLQQPVGTHSNTSLTNQHDSPALIINLDQIENPIEVKPPNNRQHGPTSAETSATNDSNHEANKDTSLTATVTKLSSPNGAEIFLIGTAHFSHQSVKDVQTLIRSVKPSSVILELCRERAFMLSLDEESLLEQNRRLSFDKVKYAIAEKGLAQGLIYIMLTKMSASLTEKLGMAPGAEFRVGAAEAQKIPGCSVILGDRSLKTTIARAVASVSIWQKMKLFYQVLANDVKITQDDVEKCKDKDMLEELLSEMGGEYPGFTQVLLHERNIFLAHSIYRWAQNSETSHGPQRVVAIVGIGHVSGIVEHWGKTTDEQIRELNEIPKASKTQIVVTKTIKYCAFAFLIYLGYRIIVPSHIQNAVHDKILIAIGDRGSQ